MSQFSYSFTSFMTLHQRAPLSMPSPHLQWYDNACTACLLPNEGKGVPWLFHFGLSLRDALLCHVPWRGAFLDSCPSTLWHPNSALCLCLIPGSHFLLFSWLQGPMLAIGIGYWSQSNYPLILQHIRVFLPFYQ